MKKILGVILIITLPILLMQAAPINALPLAPDADFPLVVHVTDHATFEDTIRFADHTNNPNEGNWITLGGGTGFELPQIKMTYNGVSDATYIRDGNEITLATYNLNKMVQYPLSYTHQTHTPSQIITYTFHGSGAHKGKLVSVRVIPVKPTALRDAARDAFRGDTSAMKTMLASSIWNNDEILDNHGDLVSKTIGKLPAGDYALVIVDETSGNPYALDVYSATAIEVLDYPSTATFPSSITRGTDLPVQIKLTGAAAADRIYGVVIIQQSRYKVDFELKSDGTTEGTSLTGEGVVLIEGTESSFSLAGVGLEGLNIDELVDKLGEAFSGGEFSVAFMDSEETQETVPLTTSGLNTGNFIVFTGVWEGVSSKLVAFKQGTVKISGPPAPPISGGGGVAVQLTPSQIEALGDAQAAATLSAMGPVTAAGIMSQISAQKAARIIGIMTKETATAIIKQMQTKAAATVMNEAENEVILNIIMDLEPAKAAAILEEMAINKVAAVLKKAVDTGKAIQFSIYMNLMNKGKAAQILLETSHEKGARLVEAMAKDNLKEAAKRVEEAIKLRLSESDPTMARKMLLSVATILDNTDTEALIDIFTEIANLPETPSTVAVAMEAMDLTKVLDVVSTWIGGASLDVLAELFSQFSDSFLSNVWGVMPVEERNILYSSLSTETVLRLPEVGEFQLSSLQVTPATLAPGQMVTVGIQVENVGRDSAVYTLMLKVDGVTEEIQKVSMSPGEKRVLQWTVSGAEIKTYNVEVNGLAGSFTVESMMAPAAFTLSSLAVDPQTVKPGDSISIAVQVQNTGGERGSKIVELKINDATWDSETVTLNAGAIETVIFTVTRNTAGTYTVAVESLLGSFTVETSEALPPTFSWIAIMAATVIIAVTGYSLYTRRKPVNSP